MIHDRSLPDPIRSFTPTTEVKDELKFLREARKSLGGESLRPIEIDMDILVDAYPREASFLASSSENMPENLSYDKHPQTPKSKIHSLSSPGPTSGRKMPNRRFFKSEHEREYARNLMKELVQIYILQGVHGKEAFRNALNETRRRIHIRRGEAAPSPPPVLSPVQESPYPKLSPPQEKTVSTPASKHDESLPVQSISASPPRRLPPLSQSTPSRVKSIVAALQVSSTPVDMPKLTPVKRTPGSTRVKAVAESFESQVSLSMTPGKKPQSASPGTEKAGDGVKPPKSISRIRKSVPDEKIDSTPPSKRKNEAIVESTSARRSSRKAVMKTSENRTDSPPTEVKRTRRAAAIAAMEELQSAPTAQKLGEEEETNSSAIKNKAVPPKKAISPNARQRKAKSNLVAIPEDEPIVVPARPVRKAKAAAGLIKK